MYDNDGYEGIGSFARRREDPCTHPLPNNEPCCAFLFKADHRGSFLSGSQSMMKLVLEIRSRNYVDIFLDFMVRNTMRIRYLTYT